MCGDRIMLRWVVDGANKSAFVTALAGAMGSDVLVVSTEGTASLELGSFRMRRSGVAVDDGVSTVQLKNGNPVVLYGTDRHDSPYVLCRRV